MNPSELFPLPPAYIDPFSGTILLQVIVAGAIGAVAFFRRAIWRAARFVLRIKPETTDPNEDGSNG